jgi:hypothetical protein
VQAIAAIPLCNEFKKPMDLLPKMLIRQMLPVVPLLFVVQSSRAEIGFAARRS